MMVSNKRRLKDTVWIGQGTELDVLRKAAQDYIEANGGKPMVIGPVELQHWPQDPKHVYRLAVRFTGKPPKQPKQGQP